MTVVLDDHLLRDWMAARDDHLVAAVGTSDIATTNLWYARLCKVAARATDGGVLRGWSRHEREALIGGLVALPDEITVLAMRDIAWPMGQLTASHHGLSMLGAEAVAASVALKARLLVSSRDDGPGIRACCKKIGVTYDALPR